MSYADLEIRILERQNSGYPVEITLEGTREFPRGHLDLSQLPWVPGVDSVADGLRLFQWLFTETMPIILLPSSGLKPYLEKYVVAIKANIPGAVRSGYRLLGRLCWSGSPAACFVCDASGAGSPSWPRCP